MDWVAFGTWVIVLHCVALALWLGSLALRKLGRAAPSTVAAVAFSQKVLFYEDGYTNSLGVGVAPYCATNVVLNCVAYGGQYGGLLQLTLNDGGRLERIGGDELPVGAIAVAANETRSFSVTYESTTHSDSEDDITATATFTETLSGETATSQDSMTVVMASIVAEALGVTNRCRRRFGVGESARIYIVPYLPVEASASSGICSNGISSIRYFAPHSAGGDTVSLSLAGDAIVIYCDVIAPMEYQVCDVYTNSCGAVGESGGFGLEFICYLLPRDVSFENVELIELPRVATNAVNYYAQECYQDLLDHGRHGADGVWKPVGEYNDLSDVATMWVNPPPWLGGGSFTWPIPNAWRVNGDIATTNLFCDTDQRFELDGDGTSRLSKFNIVGERATNGFFRVWEEVSQ